MKENLTYIAVVLDRSASMRSCQAATIAGFNAFLEEQKKEPGSVLFTLAQFDHEYQTVYDATDIRFVEPLTTKTYVPRGDTALYDAICLTINSVGKKLAALPESERPSKVLVMVQTDGAENCSMRFNASDVERLIRQQTDQYNWGFVFIGAEKASILQAREMGFAAAASYNATPGGTEAVLRAASANVSNYRRGNDTGYAAVMNAGNWSSDKK